MNCSKFFYLNVFVSALILYGCKPENKENTPDQAESRRLLLTNLADNIIMPHLNKMKSEMAKLGDAIATFEQNPSAENLTAAQNQWVSTYTQWQYVNAFNYGPGERPIFGMMLENVGTWPVNVNVVENRITAGDYQFEDFRRDSRGLLTIEYLLFGPQAFDKFVNGAYAANRLAYLKAVFKHSADWINAANDGWTSYRNTFTSDLGNAVGTPLSMFYNEFVKSFESLKNFKIGVPAGKRAGQTQPEPQRVEGYYSGLSTLFIKTHFIAITNLWKGVGADGVDRFGLDDMLTNVTGGPQLKTQTLQQIDAVNNVNSKLLENVRFSDLINQNTAQVNELFAEYQRMTRFLKSDLSSVLGIMITYSSGDGD
jgi:predicted lipoprotein